MKKIILLFISLFLTFNLAKATDITPQYTNSVGFWGIGLAKMGKDITIYQDQDENSRIVEVLKWDEAGNLYHKSISRYSIGQVFVAFLAQNNLAFMSMDDEDELWIKVCYDQKFQKFGWVKKEEGHEAYFWKDFFNTYAKQNGLYVFRDVKPEYRQLYSKPEDEAQTVDKFEYAKYITPYLMKGNWMLVKVLNYDNTKKTGWIKWRDENGRLFAFVHFR